MSDENNNENSEANANVSVNVNVSERKLDVGEILKEGIDFCVKNIVPLLVNFLLWVLTIWVPYINVGTTIGLFAGIVIKLSRGETISFTEIFDPRYRKYMGEYLLAAGLMFMGVFIGVLFLIIPGIVLSIAWNFALIVVIDKGKNPMEALTISNNITYGNKGRILLIQIIVSMIFSGIQTIFNFFDNGFAIFMLILTVVLQIILSLGIQASMYKQLIRDAR